jgi:hypothetical protein
MTTMMTMLEERLVRFGVRCETPKGQQVAVICVYYPKNGGVNVMCPAGQGFHLTRKKGPASWATWDFRQFLRDTMRPGEPIPTYLEISLWAEQFQQERGLPGEVVVVLPAGIPLEGCHPRPGPPRSIPRKIEGEDLDDSSAANRALVHRLTRPAPRPPERPRHPAHRTLMLTSAARREAALNALAARLRAVPGVSSARVWSCVSQGEPIMRVYLVLPTGPRENGVYLDVSHGDLRRSGSRPWTKTSLRENAVLVDAITAAWREWADGL